MYMYVYVCVCVCVCMCVCACACVCMVNPLRGVSSSRGLGSSFSRVLPSRRLHLHAPPIFVRGDIYVPDSRLLRPLGQLKCWDPPLGLALRARLRACRFPPTRGCSGR